MTGGSTPDLRAWVVDRLARLVPEFANAMSDETPLVDEGLCLDSIKLMELVTDIEETLEIRVEEEEVTPETFGTVGRLVRFLESRV
jgi:acyl carrier protein